MALTRNMTKTQMVDFLDKELLPQAKTEIESWIKPTKKQGGYFVVVRQILCMVDFLGAVYCGYPLSEKRSDPNGRKISTSAKAKKFIVDFFEPKQIYQTNVVTNLYEMYRHGLVHLYQPKILKLNTKNRLLWFFYKGKRKRKSISIDTNKGKVIFNDVEHLKIIRSNLNRNDYYLTVNLDTLYKDFEEAVNRYKNKLQNTKYLQRNWRTTVNAICKPR